MSLLDHVDDIAFSSSIPTDLILGTFTGSFAVAAPTSTTGPSKVTVSQVINTGIPEKTFFQGVFSVDGGTTWIDFNANIPATIGSFANLQTQMMYAYSKPGTLTVVADNWNKTANGTTFTASAYTFLYKVVLFATPVQGNISPQPITQLRSVSSAYNYQKIFRDSVFPFSFPVATTTAVITHNLGYIPKFRSYVDNMSNYAPDKNAIFDFGYLVSHFIAFQAFMDENTISYFVDNSSGVGNFTGTLYTRIYYDS